MRRVLDMAGAEVPVGLGHGEPTFAPLPVEWGDTVHLDVVDRWGNLVSATPSGGWLQSSPTIPELGFSISTRGQMCWLEPGHPSTLRPGARPRTTLTPTLVTRDGEAWLAIGTPGGDQQDQWTLGDPAASPSSRTQSASVGRHAAFYEPTLSPVVLSARG